MTNTNFIVIMIVSRSNFYSSCTKIRIHKCISNNWHRPLDERMDTVLKVKLIASMLITRIIWMYGHCNIPKHRFNTSSSNNKFLARRAFYWICKFSKNTQFNFSFVRRDRNEKKQKPRYQK
uniref:Candidate secreted effector n=1 Tax=Meloidogyne incognita TaxID=6306 RepID=A0A914KXB5_MELIC